MQFYDRYKYLLGDKNSAQYETITNRSNFLITLPYGDYLPSNVSVGSLFGHKNK